MFEFEQITWEDLGVQEGVGLISRAHLPDGFVVVAAVAPVQVPGMREPLHRGTVSFFYEMLTGPVQVASQVVGVNEPLGEIKKKAMVMWKHMPIQIKDYFAVANQRTAAMLGMAYDMGDDLS